LKLFRENLQDKIIYDEKIPILPNVNENYILNENIYIESILRLQRCCIVGNNIYPKYLADSINIFDEENLPNYRKGEGKQNCPF